jgi:hypothetical protein
LKASTDFFLWLPYDVVDGRCAYERVKFNLRTSRFYLGFNKEWLERNTTPDSGALFGIPALYNRQAIAWKRRNRPGGAQIEFNALLLAASINNIIRKPQKKICRYFQQTAFFE